MAIDVFSTIFEVIEIEGKGVSTELIGTRLALDPAAKRHRRARNRLTVAGAQLAFDPQPAVGFQDKIRLQLAGGEDLAGPEVACARIDSDEGGAAEGARRLMTLFADGAFIPGANFEAARNLLRGYVREPGFLDTYLDGVVDEGEREARLRELQRNLKTAGIA